MQASCKHSTFLSTIHSVQYRGVDVQSPKIALPFRPASEVSIVVTKRAFGLKPDVKIAIEGSAGGLKGALWVADERGRNSISPWDAQLNTNYPVSLSTNQRVFCTVWAVECSFCKAGAAQQDADHEKELQTLRAHIESFKKEKQEMAAEIAALEQEKRAGEAAVVNAKEAFVEEQKKLAADIAEAAAAEMRALANEASSRVSFQPSFLVVQIEALRSQLVDWQPKGEAADDRLPAAMWAMRSTAFLTDFRLVVGEESIRVHRTVLALKSVFFEFLFRSQPAGTEHTIEGIDREIVEQMVEFCYRGQVDGLEKNAAELYAAARRFQVASLLDACTRVLKAGITPDKAADVLVLAARHNDRFLAAFAVDYAEGSGGKFRLLVADSILSLLPAELELYKKIVRLLKEGSMLDGTSEQQPLLSGDDSQPPPALQSADDDADDRSESSASSGWEAVDAK